VLQLDPGSRYGGAWATLHLDELLQELAEAGAAAGPGAEHAHSLTGACVLRRPGAALGPSREFNLDLAPKALYGVGPMIALLLGSGAHHYAEFKLVQGRCASPVWMPRP
jgi:RAB protein geranylgeranyltransferase component A